MAISWNTGTTATSGGPGAVFLDITIPAGVNQGDLLLVAFAAFSAVSETVQASSTGTAPAIVGSSQAVSFGGNTLNAAVFSVKAGASDAGKVLRGSYVSGGLAQWAAGIGAWAGTSASSPVDVSGAAVSAGASATITCPSEITAASNDWCAEIVSAALGGSSFTGGAGFTQREAFSDPASGCTVLIYDSNASAGPAGTSIGGAQFANAGHNNWWAGFTVGLAPPPPPPGAEGAPDRHHHRTPAGKPGQARIGRGGLR